MSEKTLDSMGCREDGRRVVARQGWQLGGWSPRALSPTACRLILDKGKPVVRPGRKATGRVVASGRRAAEGMMRSEG